MEEKCRQLSTKNEELGVLLETIRTENRNEMACHDAQVKFLIYGSCFSGTTPPPSKKRRKLHYDDLCCVT